jgi:HAD superfamily hydrolase (TIGR01509 family)
MKKLVIFDLDGVLVMTRDLHYRALNDALSACGFAPIPRALHLSTYDGLPTTRKLEMLEIPEDYRQEVWERKQDSTITALALLPSDPEMRSIFYALKKRGIWVAVASNSIPDTVRVALHQLDLLDLVDCIASNTTTGRPKPYPSMYWWCMEQVGATAQSTVIIEDSHIGRQAALASGARLLPVTDRSEVTLEAILAAFDASPKPIPYRNPNLNVLVPMAGGGTRFINAGYTFPKPLIEINGKPMIQVVVENLNIEANYIFVVQKWQYEKYNLQYLLNMLAPGCKVVQVDGPTEGAACTTLLAKGYIDSLKPLLIANSDQYLEWDSNEAMYAFSADGIAGGIVTFQSKHPKWSYVRLDGEGFVAEVAEKKVISDIATTGLYYWKYGTDYVEDAEAMIAANDRVNGEFYIAPTFNYAIQAGDKIRTKMAKRMWGLGDPESLEEFMEHHK